MSKDKLIDGAELIKTLQAWKAKVLERPYAGLREDKTLEKVIAEVERMMS